MGKGSLQLQRRIRACNSKAKREANDVETEEYSRTRIWNLNTVYGDEKILLEFIIVHNFFKKS